MRSRQLEERVKSLARLLPALLLFFVTAEASEAMMLQGTITGQVVGAENQQPMGGAQVLVEGTGVGALTNQSGEFTLTDVPAGEQTVAVQLLGYARATQTVQVASGETVSVNFEITRQALALDEMVVTGTPGGTQRRALGHDVARISATDLAESMPQTDFQGIMRGQAAGMYLPAATGSVGDGQHMRMRGLNSISLSSYPLIYVDGVRVNNDRGGSMAANRNPSPALRMNDFSPNEIESIEVIKGPSAATLYGTEASAGVIQIITRQGASGAPVYEAGVEVGGTWLRDAEDRLNWNYQIDPATGDLTRWHPITSPQESPHAFQTGPLHKYNLGVSGGTDRVRYSLSGSAGYEEGYVDFNHQTQGNLRANIQAVLTDNLDMQWSSGIVRSNTRLPNTMLPYGYPGSWHWGHALRVGNDGHYVLRPEEERLIEHTSRINRTTWSMTLNHNPVEWFRHRIVFGEDRTNETADLGVERQPEGADHPGLGGRGLGEKFSTLHDAQYLSFEYAGTASFQLTPTISSSTSSGVQYYNRTNETQDLWGAEFAAPGMTTLSAASRTTGSGDFIENSSVGFYVQQEFGWQDRAFLTTAVRMDDNSAFGADFDAAVYPKLSATWVLSEEEWWDMFWVNSFRVRGAWGQAGRQPDIFAAVSLYDPVTGAGGSPAVRPGPVGNDELGPEVGEEIEVGFDAGLWDDRVSVTFNFYDQTTKDALMQVPGSMATGFTSNRWENIGEVSNRGIELTVNGAAWETPQHRWDLGVNLTTNRNRLVDLGGVPPTGGTSRLIEGLPLGTYHAVYPVDATWEGPADTGRVSEFRCRLQDGTVADCTDYDPQLHPVSWGKNSDPTWYGSVNTSVTLFNNLQLFAMVTYEGGHLVWGCRIGCSYGFFRIDPKVLGDPNNGIAPDPIYRWHADELTSTTEFGSAYDASHVRFQTVSASYTLPDAWVGQFGVTRASLQVAMNNLGFLWRAQEFSGPKHALSGRKIIDPIVNNVGGTNELSEQSHIMAFYPATKLTANLRLRF